MRTDRKKDVDKYYNDHLKMHIIRRLMLVNTWSEIKGIEGAVWEALSREETAEQDAGAHHVDKGPRHVCHLVWRPVACHEGRGHHAHQEPSGAEQLPR